MSAAVKEISEHIQTVGIIAEGEAEEEAARSEITVVGINCTEDVFKTEKMHISSDGVFGCGFKLSSSDMASIPAEVAALPTPSMFAAMLAVIFFMAIPFL